MQNISNYKLLHEICHDQVSDVAAPGVVRTHKSKLLETDEVPPYQKPSKHVSSIDQGIAAKSHHRPPANDTHISVSQTQGVFVWRNTDIFPIMVAR